MHLTTEVIAAALVADYDRVVRENIALAPHVAQAVSEAETIELYWEVTDLAAHHHGHVFSDNDDDILAAIFAATDRWHAAFVAEYAVR